MMLPVNVSALAEYQFSYTRNAVPGGNGAVSEVYPIGFLFSNGLIINENGVVDLGNDIESVQSIDRDVIAFRTNSDLWGAMDKNGNVIFEAIEADWIKAVGNGTYMAQKADGNKRTVCVFDKTGKVIIPFGKYSGVESSGNYYITLNSVPGKDNVMLKGVVDTNGKELFPTEYNNVKILGNGFFALGTEKDYVYKYGVYDVNGKEILPAEYSNFAYADSLDGADIFVCTKGNNEHGVVDKTGNVIVPFVFGQGVTAGSGVIVETKTNKVYDYKGNEIVSFTAPDFAYTIEGSENCYLYYDSAKNVTYIRKTTGENVKELPGRATYDKRNSLICSEEMNGENIKVCTYYDVFGEITTIDTFTETDTMIYCERKVFDDFGGEYFVVEAPQESKNYDVPVIVQQVSSYIQNKDGEIVFRNPKGSTLLYNDAISIISDTTTYPVKYGLVDIKGNAVLPTECDAITYNPYLNLWAISKNGTVSLGTVLPVTVKINGTDVAFDQLPVVKDDRTLVPLRAIFESLGATVEWDEKTSTVTSVLNDVTIKVTIYDNIMYKNGEPITLDVPAEIVNSRTMVPVRAISEAFGYTVDWHPSTRTVSVNK